MSSLKSKKLGLLAVGVAVFALAAAQGCSSSDDTQAGPSGGSNSTAGTGNEAGTGDVSDAGSGNVANGGSGNTGNIGNAGNTGDGAGAGGVGPDQGGSGGEAGSTPVETDCTGTNGCYSCAPTTSSQFENGCVAGGCPDTFTDVLTKKNLVGTL